MTLFLALRLAFCQLSNTVLISEKSRCPVVIIYLQRFLPLDGPGIFLCFQGWMLGVIWLTLQWLSAPMGH